MTDIFFSQFLMISEIYTLVFLTILCLFFMFIFIMQKNKASFSKRVLTGTALGLILGLFIQIMAGFPENPQTVAFIAETTTWYSLFGDGFIALVRMLVIPLIMISIIHVIINLKGADLGRLTKKTLFVTMLMVAISAALGLALGLAFNLGSGVSPVEGSSAIKEVKPIASTLLELLPSNPIAAMVKTNVIGLVIFAAFFGVAAMRMYVKHQPLVQPFYDLVNALHKIIISVAMSVIKLMPYAVIALLANTIADKGLHSILEVILFIGVLYLGITLMFALQLLALSLFGINPATYVRKGLEALVMAFTSRSSVGTLPLTIACLTRKMGVSESTANAVASFGATAGMQGCAGVFPALLIIFVANMSGTTIDATFLVMSTIVIAIGSLGIAGIPGTATMAASVALSGTGMAASFPLISPILAIDPIIDMGRTFLNVSGAMVNALIVDKQLGLLNTEEYADMQRVKFTDDSAPTEL